MMTAKIAIMGVIKREGVFLAVHEFHIKGYSENCLATRCSEMAHDGVLVGRFRIGENFKEWGFPEWIASSPDTPKSLKKAISSPNPPIWSGELPLGKETMETPLEQLVGGF